MGEVAYKLALPAQARIHPVFHISQLKKKIGSRYVSLPSLPPVDFQGLLKPEPQAILDRRVSRSGHLPITEVLVHWTGQEVEDATWERLDEIRLQFQHLVDKVL